MNAKGMILLATLIFVCASASAQTGNANTWSRGTTLSLSAGAATASPNTTATFGTALGWELTPRAEIEGAAAWLSKRRGADAFAAELKLLVNLIQPARVVPYLGGGVGLYRGMFDSATTAMPSFYRRRMMDANVATRASYTDPTIVVAGGMNLYVARHLSVKPEIAVRFVTADRHRYDVGTATVSVVYHVEEHVADTRRIVR
jgi:hypothetical protein